MGKEVPEQLLDIPSAPQGSPGLGGPALPTAGNSLSPPSPRLPAAARSALLIMAMKM